MHTAQKWHQTFLKSFTNDSKSPEVFHHTVNNRFYQSLQYGFFSMQTKVIDWPAIYPFSDTENKLFQCIFA